MASKRCMLLLQAHYLTVPLSARRAAGVLGHDFKKMGLRASQIDHATYANCSHPDPQTFHVVRPRLAAHPSHWPC